MNVFLRNSVLQNVAVWNSMKLHLNLIQKTNINLTFYVKDSFDITNLTKEYSDCRIVFFSSYFDLFKKINRTERVFCFDIFSVLFAKFLMLMPSSKIYFWVQGIIPEESFLRNKSILRFKILSFLEKLALKVSGFLILVSASMPVFFEEKYKMKLNKHIVIPCKSEFNIDFKVDKRDCSFVYIGGLSAWQKVDQALLYYIKVKQKYDNATFDIITFNVDEAKKLVSQYVKEKEVSESINIYRVNDRSTLPSILSKFQYGFLFREFNEVNKVSSPIKFAEYLSCGINVICSKSIPHYSQILQDYGCGYSPENVSIDDCKVDLKFDLNNALIAYKENFSDKVFFKRYQSIIDN